MVGGNGSVKVVTVAEFIDAIEQDGLEQAFNSYFIAEGGDKSIYVMKGSIGKYEEEIFIEYKVGAACAVGQAAINLGLDPESLVASSGFLAYIFKLNDTLKMPLKEIANKARKDFADKLDYIIRGKELDYTDKVIRKDTK